ncbi:D-serine ammonia-lyase [Ectobacillus ponti]|uniref:Probable D-serine dehydratase n=1 Tax=Ectobacillus ponti TaxID=2961894 RepID=A0AA41X8B0_9BACI|nr:D-serine ammonia-lyase [Ectobacillus ponti]MCP8970739.1 D-serine ammonia-lyase [Ectobacillus ponti]
MEERTKEEWLKKQPMLQEVSQAREVFWENPRYGEPHFALDESDIQDAAGRLERFAPYIARVFPGTNGLIESPIREIPAMQQALSEPYATIPGRLLLKLDSHLPISGSIKARGGIYEVLKYAEQLALQHGLLKQGDSYAKLAEPEATAFFSRYRIAVGSTGNLGLSIGIMGAQLGFGVTVHMSADAASWKKNLLRQKGVTVKEYADDYSKAVETGRLEAAADPHCHFVDDENSKDLFLGYAVAAYRLQKQLAGAGIPVDAEHPLFVYLPCGVGGGPGGVTFGLKTVYGSHAHCFFAEPVQSPCMLIGMMTGLHDEVSVRDFGLRNETAADGLAVGRPSRFVGREMESSLSGIYTVEDTQLFRLLRMLAEREGLFLEPSALAGMYGPVQLLRTASGQAYTSRLPLEQATHLVWATGGSMVPDDVMQTYYQRLW